MSLCMCVCRKTCIYICMNVLDVILCHCSLIWVCQQTQVQGTYFHLKNQHFYEQENFCLLYSSIPNRDCACPEYDSELVVWMLA